MNEWTTHNVTYRNAVILLNEHTLFQGVREVCGAETFNGSNYSSQRKNQFWIAAKLLGSIKIHFIVILLFRQFIMVCLARREKKTNTHPQKYDQFKWANDTAELCIKHSNSFALKRKNWDQ